MPRILGLSYIYILFVCLFVSIFTILPGVPPGKRLCHFYLGTPKHIYMEATWMDTPQIIHSLTQSYICYMFTKHLTCEVLIKQANMVKMRCMKGVHSLRMGVLVFSLAVHILISKQYRED